MQGHCAAPDVAKVLEPRPVRIYLCGGLAVREGPTVLGPDDFAGPQAELVFSILANHHLRPVASAELADTVWLERTSTAWRASLRALVSRVRATLSRTSSIRIRSGDSWYQLVLPRESTIDCVLAAEAIHAAEALLDSGSVDDALAHAAVASMIAVRPVLPEVAHAWVDALAARMQAIHLRALDVLVQLWTVRGQYAEAIVDAEKMLEIDPLHEGAYAGLMRAHLLCGNPTLGLRAYERCRQRFWRELGASPGPGVEKLYQKLLDIT
jgi:DNA-binding SARP family transcriptional activator